MYVFAFILLISVNICQSFFKNPPLQIDSLKNRLNLTCATDFSDTEDLFTNCEYCVYEFFNNGTDSTVYHDCIHLTNSYRLVSQRCSGFTDTSDIGYGLCSALPFEYFDIDLLCICATDLCNENFTTCKQSVDSNAKLPVLVTPIPVFTAQSSAVTCQDTPLGVFNSTYYCVRDATPYINITQCDEYVKNHTVVCMYLESDNGSYLTLVAVPDEDYDYVLAEQIELMQRMAIRSNVQQYYNETTSMFYVQWKETLEDVDNQSMIYNKCYCRTNNCNVNLTACFQSYIAVSKTNTKTNNILFVILAGFIGTSHFLIYL